MVALRGLGAAAFAAAVTASVLRVAPAGAEPGATTTPSFLPLAGTDVWRDGLFLYGGVLWSPGGLDTDGFTLKLLLSGGGYKYFSNGLRMDVDGNMSSAAVLPGWRFTRDGITIDLFAGPLVQDYRLTPNDPGSWLHGFYGGGQFATDVWYQPDPATMIALNGSVATIGPSGSLRAAAGARLLDAFFFGPETQGIWCTNYQEVRFGFHVTGLRIQALEWSAASGWEMEAHGRNGPYLRLGVTTHY